MADIVTETTDSIDSPNSLDSTDSTGRTVGAHATDTTAGTDAAGVAATPPRISRLRAGAIVVAGLAVAGSLVGALWAWLAPPIHGVVALSKRGDRVHAYLGSEADHFFVAAAMLLGMLTVLAVVGGVLVWQWRAHRGPVAVAAVSIGSAVAAVAAAAVGSGLARVRYGVLDFDAAPVTPEHRLHYFAEAPSAFFGHTPLQMVAGLAVPAAVAALVYALQAAVSVRDDLGAYPPQEPSPAPQPDSGGEPITVDGG